MCEYPEMIQAQTKLTSRGQVSVPAVIRHALGVKPGSVIEWQLVGDTITVTRAVRAGTSDVRTALFGSSKTGVDSPAPKTLQELKAGIALSMRQRHARPHARPNARS
jgi:AbrB family looped-hinge helix DNA binding protein